MAGINTQEILVGAADIYLGPSGTTRPALPAGAYKPVLDLAATWSHVGFTQEGLEMSYAPDYTDVEVDQWLDSALTFKSSMRVTFNTTLAQATLYNLMLAWGQSSTTLTSTASDATLDIGEGGLGDAPVERGLIALGNGAHGRTVGQATYSERFYHAFRIISVDETTHSLRRAENSAIPVSFRALPDVTTSKYGQIKERKRTWLILLNV